MTNLLEKSLIIGFGIFTLIIFLSVISPFIKEIKEYEEDKEDREDQNNEIIDFINKINLEINKLIDGEKKYVSEEIYYPDRLNLTFNSNYAKFEFIFDNDLDKKILYYNCEFVEKYFSLPPNIYIVNISCQYGMINFIISN
ncbi:MAG: hypothetical protein EU539_01500 [Promethearchaeota archaeon]|nr:MAG: hypothetical protein EU539_01500 [Candidatus Lokiarchaeota archaeon]